MQERRSCLRLLLVEDDDELRPALTELLLEEGYAVESAATATEGLAKLRSALFQLVVSDYRLPDQTGAWMLDCAAAEGLLKRTKVLLITAQVSPQGVSGLKILRKPFAVERFLDTIARLAEPVAQSERVS